MLEALQYVLGDFWHFVGACVLLSIVTGGIASSVGIVAMAILGHKCDGGTGKDGDR